MTKDMKEGSQPLICKCQMSNHEKVRVIHKRQREIVFDVVGLDLVLWLEGKIVTGIINVVSNDTRIKLCLLL